MSCSTRCGPSDGSTPAQVHGRRREEEASRIRRRRRASRWRASEPGATEDAARIRGEADAEAARIYAEAHREDPELYRFTRGLESLSKIVGDETTLVLRTDAEPLSLLKSQKP